MLTEDEENDNLDDDSRSRYSIATSSQHSQANPSSSRMQGSYTNSIRSKKMQEKILKKTKDMIRRRRYNQHLDELKKQKLDIDRRVKEKLEDAKYEKEKYFQTIYDDVLQGMNHCSNVKRALDLHHENLVNKNKRQYEQWNNNVYGEIQRGIEREVDKAEYKHINLRKRETFQEFLDQTNKKPSIFRDIIIESEYDPLELNRKSIKINTGRLIDPIKRLIQKHDEEADTLVSSGKKELGFRKSLDTKMWATGKIEDTPHGCFARMMREGRTQSERTIKLSRSKIDFDHYNIPIGKDALRGEFPGGKKVTGTDGYKAFDESGLLK